MNHRIVFATSKFEIYLALKCYNIHFHCQNPFYFVSLSVFSPMHITLGFTVKDNLKVSLKDYSSTILLKEEKVGLYITCTPTQDILH